MPVKNRKKNAQPFLSLPEVQTLLGVKSRKTILKYILRGELTAYKLGGTRWRIARQDVDSFVNSHQAAVPVKSGE